MQYSISKAKIEESSGIHNLLLKNLVEEIQDVKELTLAQRHTLETKGFLRKEVPQEYYSNLIQNPDVDIFIAKNKEDIIGFATFHLKKSDIRSFRTTLQSYDIENPEILDLLTNTERSFIYLDQVSIDPKYKRKGVGRALIQHVQPLLTAPMVSFVVMKPLANLASSRWHENLGFTLVGLANGSYKNTSFEWEIYASL